LLLLCYIIYNSIFFFNFIFLIFFIFTSGNHTPGTRFYSDLLDQGRSQQLEGGTADGNPEAGSLGGCAPQKLEGYTVIAGSFVAAF